MYAEGRIPTRAELVGYAEAQGWMVQQKNPGGPPMYLDDNGVRRLTIKRGSPRTPGSEGPHIELRDEQGRRVDPAGNLVARRAPGNHYPYHDEPPEKQEKSP